MISSTHLHAVTYTPHHHHHHGACVQLSRRNRIDRRSTFDNRLVLSSQAQPVHAQAGSARPCPTPSLPARPPLPSLSLYPRRARPERVTSRPTRLCLVVGKTSSNVFQVGGLLDFLGLSARTVRPMWALNTCGEPNEIELKAANGLFDRSFLGPHPPPTPTLAGTPRQPFNITPRGASPIPLVPPHVRRTPCGMGAQHVWCLAA